VLGVRRWREIWQIGKNGRTFFDMPKLTVGCSAKWKKKEEEEEKEDEEEKDEEEEEKEVKEEEEEEEEEKFQETLRPPMLREVLFYFR